MILDIINNILNFLGFSNDSAAIPDGIGGFQFSPIQTTRETFFKNKKIQFREIK
jgi:hypothetical protein